MTTHPTSVSGASPNLTQRRSADATDRRAARISPSHHVAFEVFGLAAATLAREAPMAAASRGMRLP